MINKSLSWLSGLSRVAGANDSGQPSMQLSRQMRWQLRQRLATLGWPGMIAIALLVAAPLFYLSAVRPMQARLETAQRNTALLQEQILQAAKKAQGGPTTPREQLDEFYKFFPKEKESPQWLEKLVGVAEDNDLSLNDGEYKVTRDKVGQLVRIRISLPVSGKYTQIREFLAALPKEVPATSLENIQFERKDVAGSDVQVKIRLVLYLVQES